MDTLSKVKRKRLKSMRLKAKTTFANAGTLTICLEVGNVQKFLKRIRTARGLDKYCYEIGLDIVYGENGEDII